MMYLRWAWPEMSRRGHRLQGWCFFCSWMPSACLLFLDQGLRTKLLIKSIACQRSLLRYCMAICEATWRHSAIGQSKKCEVVWVFKHHRRIFMRKASCVLGLGLDLIVYQGLHQVWLWDLQAPFCQKTASRLSRCKLSLVFTHWIV